VAWAEAYIFTKWHLDPFNRLATSDMDRKLGVPPFCSGLGPHLVQFGLGRCLPPHQVASWSIQPFDHNRHGPKIGGLCPFGGGELGPNLTQCGQGRGLAACQVFILIHPTAWSQYTKVTDRIGQTDRQTDRQANKQERIDSIGRTVLQTVA